MKYIRTKDGIVSCGFSKEEYDSKYPNTKISYEEWFDIAFRNNKEYEIIKTADTIEELCDRFVITEHGLDDNFLMEDFKDVKKFFVGKATVYGAIWTDKGLIYVAKMNDEGCLELL